MLFKKKRNKLEVFPDIIGLIASKNPVSALEKTVKSLLEGGAKKVIVVNDGSDNEDSLNVFQTIKVIEGVEVVNLERNVGKATALKEGFKRIPVGSVIAQTDDDTLAGNLKLPLEMILKGKAEIIDIRVETNHTKTLIGLIQELDYWMINAFIKRFQDLFRSRLWMSGASVMYTYRAGRVLLLEQAYTVTEDTEGMFRALSKGINMRFCSNKAAQFITMVPEDYRGLRKQWQRWAIGNGQVIGLYGLGGGLKRVSFMNALAWFLLTILPIPFIIINGLVSSLEWILIYSVIVGVLGAISLRRPAVILASPLLPVISVVWILHAVEGIIRALKKPISTGHLTWISPKRTTF